MLGGYPSAEMLDKFVLGGLKRAVDAGRDDNIPKRRRTDGQACPPFRLEDKSTRASGVVAAIPSFGTVHLPVFKLSNGDILGAGP